MSKKFDTALQEGKRVNIRDIDEKDASFVLSLRIDEKKSQFLHKTENNLQKQIEYIRKYKDLHHEWYFIIENKQGKALGTYRIYDLQDDSFCIGSWLMLDNCSPEEVLEGDFLVRNFGFEVTGFAKIHFDVRKDNKKVLRYHKLVGAKQVGETDLDYLFECGKDDYMTSYGCLVKD